VVHSLVSRDFFAAAFTPPGHHSLSKRSLGQLQRLEMFDKAIAAVKADKAKALDMFNKGEGGFRDRDLYVFCFDANTGIFNAQVVKNLLGTDIRLVKEKDGSPLGQKIFDAIKEGSVNTVSYNFPRPGSDVPVAKESYVTAVGNQACGVGYYK
jgi:cytochrome c